MAITVVNQKTALSYHPAANPINMTVNSNNSGNCNMRYIADVYINGVKVFRDKLFPDPSTGYAFFQFSRIIQDYIRDSVPYAPYSNIFNAATSTTYPSVLTVYIKFGEEYDSTADCSGAVTQYADLVTSNTFYAFNAAIPYEDFPTFDYTQYLVGTVSSPTTKFLTNAPRTADVTWNDSFYLDFLTNNNITTSYAILVKSYSGGGVLSSFYITANVVVGAKRVRISVGPADINNKYGIPMIDTLAQSYDIQLVWGPSFVPVSEVYSFKVKKPGTFRTRISYIGLLGGIEFFTFYHRNKKSYELDRKTFKKTLNSNNSGVWSYQVGDRQSTTYAINASENHVVASYVNRDQSEWLTELWMSPNAWTYKGPECSELVIYRSGGAVGVPTDKMLFRMKDDHGLVVGDTIMVFPDTAEIATNYDYSNSFVITGVNGNIIDCNLTYGVYALTELSCAIYYKVGNWVRLPITLNDKKIEVKQKLQKPIEYELSYTMSFDKTTLR